MARKIRAREVLRLLESGMSRNAIARSQGMSKHSVQAVSEAAEAAGIGWAEAEGMSDAEVYAALFPEKVRDRDVYPDPDWERVHRELARVGVTLKRLHEEYRDEQRSKGEPFMSYDRFCKRYREFTVRRQVVSRVGHRAGRMLEVDWAGPTMALVDPATGEVSKVFLFVACLPFSRLSYVEPTLDMRQDTWLRCHVHAFAYIGGSTPRIVPVNLKAGVTRHPKEGEVELNGAYREMAAHYGSAVMPARVATPRDKPSAENEVWQAALEIIAALRDEVFTDFNQLKAAVAAKLEEHNARPFTKREGTRREVFEEQERPLLRPLPAGLRVGLRPQGAAQPPRRLQAQLLLGEPPRGRQDGRPEGHRHDGRDIPRRRAARHPPAVPGLRPEPLLHARRRPPRGQVVLRLGRGAHTQVGRPRRAVLQGGGGPHLPARGLRGAGLRRRPRRAQARAPLHEAEARAGVRAGAGLGRAIPQVQAPEAHLGDQPGPGLPRACR